MVTVMMERLPIPRPCSLDTTHWSMCVQSVWHAIIWLILNDIMHSASQQYWIISMDFNWERSLVIIRLSGLSHSCLILWAGNTIVSNIRFIYSVVVMSLIFTRIPQMAVTQFQYWQMDIKQILKFNIKTQNCLKANKSFYK